MRSKSVRTEYLKKIEAMGGMLRAIETGYVQREIQESAYRYQKAIETQEQIVVGVNRFQLEAEPPVQVLRIDPASNRRRSSVCARCASDVIRTL